MPATGAADTAVQIGIAALLVLIGIAGILTARRRT